MFDFFLFMLIYTFQNIKMNVEYLLKDIPLDSQDERQDVQHDSKRERLSAIVAGGGLYLGHELQLSDKVGMTSHKIDKLYYRYESRLGADITKTLGNLVINLYVVFVSKYFNVINEQMQKDF